MMCFFGRATQYDIHQIRVSSGFIIDCRPPQHAEWPVTVVNESKMNSVRCRRATSSLVTSGVSRSWLTKQVVTYPRSCGCNVPTWIILKASKSPASLALLSKLSYWLVYMTRNIRAPIWGYASLAPSLLHIWYRLYSSNTHHPEPAESTLIICKHSIQVGRINLEPSQAIDSTQALVTT